MSGRFVVLVDSVVPSQGLRVRSRARRPPRARWWPAGIVSDPQLAQVMVTVLAGTSPGVQARALPVEELSTELGSEEAERVLDRVRNPTLGESARARDLERAAVARLHGTVPDAPPKQLPSRSAPRAAVREAVQTRLDRVEAPSPVTAPAAVEPELEPKPAQLRRSLGERRGSGERRLAAAQGLAARVIRSVDRRESGERRSGADRREQSRSAA